MSAVADIVSGNTQTHYTVVIWRDQVSGTDTYEAWFKGRMLDRKGGPALIHRDAVTGEVTRAEWQQDGRLIEPSLPVHEAWLKSEALKRVKD